MLAKVSNGLYFIVFSQSLGLLVQEVQQAMKNQPQINDKLGFFSGEVRGDGIQKMISENGFRQGEELLPT